MQDLKRALQMFHMKEVQCKGFFLQTNNTLLRICEQHNLKKYYSSYHGSEEFAGFLTYFPPQYSLVVMTKLDLLESKEKAG